MFRAARLRLAAFYAGSVAALLIVLGMSAYLLLSDSLDDEIDDSLESSAELLVTDGTGSNAAGQRSGNGGPGGPASTGEGYQHEPRPQSKPLPSNVFLVITSKDGTIVSNPREIDVAGVDFARLCAGYEGNQSITDVSSDEGRLRVLTFQGPEEVADGTVLHVARSLTARDNQLATLRDVMLWGGLAGLVASSLGGFWLAGRTLDPIRRSFDSQRRFISDASHELRTPIAVVRANAELLARHRSSSVEENIDQVEAITSESEHMTGLVDDLLTLARADEGRLEMAHEAVDLADIANDVARDLSVVAAMREIDLIVNAAPALVEGDRSRLRQVAMVLVDNALKYTPTGGTVTVRARRIGRRAELTVTDTGPGIPKDEQARIFDRFYRTAAARSHDEVSTGGTGLGLAIAKTLVGMHGGQLGVESTPGRGSTFWVRLPAIQ